LPPLGWTLEKSRKKRDTTRLAKHATKHEVKQVYTVGELPQIHEALIKRGLYSILGVNVSTAYVDSRSMDDHVEAGFYVPVMYKRQLKPFYSLVFATKNQAPSDIDAFRQLLDNMRLHAVFHAGVSNFIYDYAETLASHHNPDNEHPDYRHVMELSKLPRPFRCWSSTTFQRWSESRAADKLITIG
jgi:hypothetical protein